MTATARGPFEKPSDPLEPSAPFPPLPFHVKHDYKGYKGLWKYRYPTIYLNVTYHPTVVSLSSFRPIVLVLCDIDVLT